jgi:signal transduction histidine kinase
MASADGAPIQLRLVNDLVDIADVLASPADAATKLDRLCAAAVVTIGCDRSSIFLVDDGWYRARHNHGNPPDIAVLFPQHRVALDDPLICRAVETRSHVIANDATNDQLMNRRVAELARIRAIVVVPLFEIGGSVAGFMTAEYNERQGSFDDLSSGLLLGLAKLGEAVLNAERAAAERRELGRQLEIANRLDALARLAATVAHDLNNQIFAIQGFAIALRAKHPGPEIERLIEAAEATGQLGRRLLVIGRDGSIEAARPLDLAKVVRDVADRLRRSVPRHALVLDLLPGLLVMGSATELEQILFNLVINAGDAAPAGSEITIRLQGPVERAVLRSPAAALSVIDRGAGIEPDLASRIFEPFFTTKPSGSGSGLGLTSVQSVVSSLGGSVRVENGPGGGTAFTVHLPVVEAGV